MGSIFSFSASSSMATSRADGAGGFAGGALEGGDAEVLIDHAMRGGVGFGVIEEAGGKGGGFEESLP